MTTAGGGHQQADAIARRGLMLVLSSPSGAGKTTLSRMLLAADPGVELSVSVTTRTQRPGEVDGRDYHFIDAPRFDAMVENGELLEWAQVFGNRYGTPRAPVEAALVRGPRRPVRHRLAGHAAAARKGARRSRQHFRPAAVDSGSRAAAANAARRISMRSSTRAWRKAADEMSHWAGIRLRDHQHRHRIAPLLRCDAILAAERLKRERQTGLSDFVRRLQAEL